MLHVSLPGSRESSRLGMCDCVELKAFSKSYSGVYLRISYKPTWKHVIKCIQLYH
jgi:hypothetical protein